jgi:DNA mismatch repair protein MutS2
MNNQAFKTLEFDSLRELVRRYSQTEMGRARVEAIQPVEGLEALRRALQQTAEAIELRQRGLRFSLEGLSDPAEAVALLKIEGAALEPAAMLGLVGLCEAAIDARVSMLADRDSCPALFEIVAALPQELKKLTATITKKILPNGEIDDRASPELARIRREIARLRSSITRSLEKLMRSSTDAIQEELVTVRNDRFVIPVRADHRGRINGVAHGSSSSGATIFIEPMQTIEANNELQTLREAEQREIAEILFGLSEDLRHELPGIEAAAEAIARLDFVNAKAAFAERFNCAVPSVSEPGAVAIGSKSQVVRSDPVATAPDSDTILEFIEARHPLLEESLRASDSQVVPVSFGLDDEKTTVVISGANAGGKTVVLKTAGLLSLMALSGLPVPAKKARVPFYRSILADIGDHQSLAANLSTFTSHVANIASMIETVEMPALVLLDEVGTGTDPEEGSALGVAVVDEFKQRGAHVLATTHYSGLKMYAANEAGVLNASVEFDERTLRPTYRLLVGIAGSSSGLEIARRFGIPTEVVGKASEQVKKTSRDAIEYLRRIKHEAEQSETLRRALEEERTAVAEKFATLDGQFQKRERERQAEFEKELDRAVTKFESNSRELAAKIQDRADRVKVEREAQKQVAELKREAQRAAQAAQKANQASMAKDREASMPPQLRGVRVVRDGKVVSQGEKSERRDEQESEDVRAPRISERDIQAGDRVKLLSFGSTGIVDRIKGDEAEVRVRSLRMREKLSNLELVGGTGVPPVSHAQDARATSKRGSSPTVREGSLEQMKRRAATTELHLHSKEADAKFKNNSELNLIGKTTDEAVDLADKFLDQAFLNGLTEVRIIHGHGTGALRKAIAELLAGHPHVARFAAAPQDHGGTGATAVELRQ